MPADAKHDDPSLMPPVLARTAGVKKNTKSAREEENEDGIATIVLFLLRVDGADTTTSYVATR